MEKPMGTTLMVKGDMSPLIAFMRMLQSVQGAELLLYAARKHPADLIKVDSIYRTTNGTRELLLRFYPSERYLRLAGTVLARDFNGDLTDWSGHA